VSFIALLSINDFLPRDDDGGQRDVVKVEVGIAGWRVVAMILEAVEILVALATDLTAIWFFFLHANGPWIRYRRHGIDYRERTIAVLL